MWGLPTVNPWAPCGTNQQPSIIRRMEIQCLQAQQQCGSKRNMLWRAGSQATKPVPLSFSQRCTTVPLLTSGKDKEVWFPSPQFQ